MCWYIFLCHVFGIPDLCVNTRGSPLLFIYSKTWYVWYYLLCFKWDMSHLWDMFAIILTLIFRLRKLTFYLCLFFWLIFIFVIIFNLFFRVCKLIHNSRYFGVIRSCILPKIFIFRCSCHYIWFYDILFFNSWSWFCLFLL